MNADNTTALFAAFPELFPAQAMDETTGLMGYGFECDDGWYAIVRDVLAELSSIRATLPGDERDAFWVFQVKEKFGGLRIYLDTIPSAAREEACDAIARAEERAAVTCEECGKPGTLRPGGWLMTLCDEHAANRKKAWS